MKAHSGIMATVNKRPWPAQVWGTPLLTLQQGASPLAPEAAELAAVLADAHSNEARQPSLRGAALHLASKVLKNTKAAPQVRAAAASIVGALTAQTCSSCDLAGSEPSTEVVLPDPILISGLVECMRSAQPGSFLVAETTACLASMLRCTSCGSPCSRMLQQHICSHGAIPAVLHGLRSGLSIPGPQWLLPPPWLAPALEALSLLVSGMPPASLTDLASDGWSLVKSVMAQCAKDADVNSHIAIILAALFPVWTLNGSASGRPDVSPAIHADSLLLVANVAAANAAHGHIKTARNATWALASMAEHAAWHPALSDGRLPLQQQQQLWVMLTGQVMLIVMNILANVAQQDHALAKNCLKYIEIVASACQRGGHSAAVAACGDGSASQFLRDASQLAYSVARLTSDLRLQVAALRCMRALLELPHVTGTLSDDEVVAMLLRTTSLARFTPGCNPKDVALVQAYGVCVLSMLLAVDTCTKNILPCTATSIAPETHASLASVVGFVHDQVMARNSGNLLPWQMEEVTHEPEGCMCRHGPSCVCSHEDMGPALVGSVAAAAAQLLHWCGNGGHAPAGVNAPDGSGVTVLHRLAAAGLSDAVRAFMTVAGPSLDLQHRDAAGLTALDVARQRGHNEVASILMDAMRGVPMTPGPLHHSATVPAPNSFSPTLPAAPAISMPASLGMSLGTPRSGQHQSDVLRLNNVSQAAGGTHASFTSQGSVSIAPEVAGESHPITPTTMEDGVSGKAMGDAGFRVNTAALSQLIGSVVENSNKHTLSSLPPWLSAGVAAAVIAHEEAVARLAASGGSNSGNSQPNSATHTSSLRAEDLALIADAEALINSHRFARVSSTSGGGSAGAAEIDDGAFETSPGGKGVSKHLWLGNLSTKLPRSVLKAVFEHFGAVEDVVTFPGRMYAFVNFKNPEDAVRAATSLNDREVPPLTGNRRLVVKFRPSKKALGKSADGPGADAAAAAAAAASKQPVASSVGDESEVNPAAAAAAAGSVAAQSQGMEAHGCVTTSSRPALSKSASRTSISSSKEDESGSNSGSGVACSSNSDSGGDLMNKSTVHASASPGSEGAPPMGEHGMTGSHPLANTGSEDDLAGGTGSASDSMCDHGSNLQPGSSSKHLHSSRLGMTSSACDGDATQLGSSSPDSLTDGDDVTFAEGRPSRHLWLGNIPLRPNKQAMEVLFSQFGPLESVRVFPGKTFAFVNYMDAAHAMQAKRALDGQMASSVTGIKPLAIRFQKDTPTSTPSPKQSGSPTSASPAGAGPGDDAPAGSDRARSPTPVMDTPQPPSASASCQQLMSAVATAARNAAASKPSNAPLPPMPSAGSSTSAGAPHTLADAVIASRVPALAGLGAAGLSKLLDEDIPQEPAINLSNRLNPNNVHFDKELAARYKRMTKAEKEALWAQDRMMQQMASSTAAAALLSAAQGMDSSTAALLASAGLGLGGRPLTGLSRPSAGDLTDLQALMLPQALGGSNLAVAAAAAAAAQAQLPGAGMARAGSLQNLWGGANTAAAAQAALLQAQLGLLAGNNTAAGGLAGLQAQLLQQQQLAALGMGNSSATLAATQQLQQQLAALGLGGNSGLPGVSADQLLAQLHQLQNQQQQAALLSNLQAQNNLNRSQQDLNALLQAQALAQLKAGQQAVTGNRYMPASGSGLQSNNSFMAQQLFQGAQNSFNNNNGLNTTTGNNSNRQMDAQQLQLMQQLMQQQQQQQQQATQQQQAAMLKQLPASLLCPLSGVLMTDPVVAADGVTYERAAIAEWLERHSVSPTTHHPLANKFLAPNNSLKAVVHQELARHAMA